MYLEVHKNPFGFWDLGFRFFFFFFGGGVVLGGSWVGISGAISRLAKLITHIRGHITTMNLQVGGDPL